MFGGLFNSLLGKSPEKKAPPQALNQPGTITKIIENVKNHPVVSSITAAALAMGSLWYTSNKKPQAPVMNPAPVVKKEEKKEDGKWSKSLKKGQNPWTIAKNHGVPEDERTLDNFNEHFTVRVGKKVVHIDAETERHLPVGTIVEYTPGDLGVSVITSNVVTGAKNISTTARVLPTVSPEITVEVIAEDVADIAHANSPTMPQAGMVKTPEVTTDDPKKQAQITPQTTTKNIQIQPLEPLPSTPKITPSFELQNIKPRVVNAIVPEEEASTVLSVEVPHVDRIPTQIRPNVSITKPEKTVDVTKIVKKAQAEAKRLEEAKKLEEARQAKLAADKQRRKEEKEERERAAFEAHLLRETRKMEAKKAEEAKKIAKAEEKKLQAEKLKKAQEAKAKQAEIDRIAQEAESKKKSEVLAQKRAEKAKQEEARKQALAKKKAEKAEALRVAKAQKEEEAKKLAEAKKKEQGAKKAQQEVRAIVAHVSTRTGNSARLGREDLSIEGIFRKMDQGLPLSENEQNRHDWYFGRQFQEEAKKSLAAKAKRVAGVFIAKDGEGFVTSAGWLVGGQKATYKGQEVVLRARADNGDPAIEIAGNLKTISADEFRRSVIINQKSAQQSVKEAPKSSVFDQKIDVNASNIMPLKTLQELLEKTDEDQSVFTELASVNETIESPLIARDLVFKPGEMVVYNAPSRPFGAECIVVGQSESGGLILDFADIELRKELGRFILPVDKIQDSISRLDEDDTPIAFELDKKVA